MTCALADKLAEASHELTERVLAEMYEDPFWAARFGDRGRRHAGADGNYHVSYLAQALVADDPHILGNYARWLRTLLVSRGMCTEHLRDNFARLADAIGVLLPDAGRAIAYLAGAQRALTYDVGAAGELEQATPALLRTLAAKRRADAEALASSDDMGVHLSYLADALHAVRPELFAAHAVWWDRFLRSRGGAHEPLVTTLRAIGAAVDGLPGASDSLRTRAHGTLAAALDALAGVGAEANLPGAQS